MISHQADSQTSRNEALESSFVFAETVEVFSWFQDWPLLCGRLKLREGAAGRQVRQRSKEHLATALWRTLQGLTEASHGPLSAAVEVTTGELGRPLLLMAGRGIANVSFSYCGGELWAVVCSPSWCCGIDLAGRQEFGTGYPRHRVFSVAELSRGSEMTCGDPEDAAALLWSAKEAVVKALGWGFHFLKPRDVRLERTVGDANGFEMQARLVGRWATVLVQARHRLVSVRTVRIGNYWVSVAVVPRELYRGQQLRGWH